jgi:hypothetical protein
MAGDDMWPEGDVCLGTKGDRGRCVPGPGAGAWPGTMRAWCGGRSAAGSRSMAGNRSVTA